MEKFFEKIQDRIEALRVLQLRDRALSLESRSLKESISEDLKERYSLFQDYNSRKVYFDYDRSLEEELNIIERSLPLSTGYVRIPASLYWRSLDYLLLNEKYGIKIPRVWYSYNLLGGLQSSFDKYSISQEGFLQIRRGSKDSALVYPRDIEIHLEVLKGNPRIDQRKFRDLLKFLKRMFELKKDYLEFGELPRFKELQEYSSLYDWSEAEKFITFLEKLPELDPWYQTFEKKMKELGERRDALLTDLKDCNKSFRVLQSLRSK